jgi:hypothetical protein
MAAAVVSAALFLGYGSLVLFSGGMRAEFERFGLARVRRLTGALEVVGGLGLLVGLAIPAVMPIAAGGLALLMLLGVITRLRVRDPLLEIVPAAVLMLLNTFVVVATAGALRGA